MKGCPILRSKWILGLALLILVPQFQNCGRNFDLTTPPVSQKENTTELDSEEVVDDLGDFEKIYYGPLVEWISETEEEMRDTLPTLQQMYGTHALVLDFSKKEVGLLENQDSLPEQVCALSDSVILQIQSLVRDAQICTQKVDPSQTACLMYPIADLIFQRSSGEKIKLRPYACAQGMDLCGNIKFELRQVLKQISCE